LFLPLCFFDADKLGAGTDLTTKNALIKDVFGFTRSKLCFHTGSICARVRYFTRAKNVLGFYSVDPAEALQGQLGQPSH